MQMAIAATGNVYFIERTGALKVYQPAEAATVVVGRLNVSTDVEDGLLGIALDSSFERTGWVFLYYAPRSVIQSCLSRFTISNSVLDLASERRLFCLPTQRQECCHSGGALKFDYARNFLYLALGDNTSPYGDSDSFAPLDERPGRANFDAQRTAANTMDLRGKILRIVPFENGSYACPADNLFVSGPFRARGRPEIYVMGVRNPFRFSINPATGTLYWAEVGPNSEPSALRGPRGVDEINMAPTAGNYGWPYCIGPNWAYRNWDFAQKTATRSFDCGHLTNTSPNKDKGGSEVLPAARPAMLWYGYILQPEYPEIGPGITSPRTPGRCAMLGSFYQHDLPSAGLSSTTNVLPAYFNNTVFFMEWRREYIMEVKLDAAGQILKLNPMWSSFEWRGPIDMAIAADGWIYVAEYGTDFEGLVRPARISRIRYTPNQKLPICDIVATPASGKSPLPVSLSAWASVDPAGMPLTFHWTIAGASPQEQPPVANVSVVFPTNGAYAAKVTVRNGMGSESTCSAPIVVGNTAPNVTFAFPPSGAIFAWGGKLSFRVLVSDAEDGSSDVGSIDCAQVEVQPQLGHDNHYHSLVSRFGCTGEFETLLAGHESEGDLFYALEARVVDKGSGCAAVCSSLILLY